jgi:hypothetical protein
MKKFLLFYIFSFSFSFLGQENCESARLKYLQDNPDVKNAGMDPWFHYRTFGQKEGRKWSECASNQIQILNKDASNNSKLNSSSLFTNELACFSKISNEFNRIPIRNKTIDSILNLYNSQFKNSCDKKQALCAYEDFKKLKIRYLSDFWLEKKLKKTFNLRDNNTDELKDFATLINDDKSVFYLMLRFNPTKNNSSFGRKFSDYQLFDLNQYKEPKNKLQEIFWKISFNRNLRIKSVRNEILISQASQVNDTYPYTPEIFQNGFLFLLTGINKEYFELQKEKSNNDKLIDSLSKNYTSMYPGLNYIGEIKNKQRNGFGILLTENNDTLTYGYWDKNILTTKRIENETSKKLFNSTSYQNTLYPKIFVNEKIQTSLNFNDSLKDLEKDFIQFFDNGIYFGQKLTGNNLSEGLFFYTNGNVFFGKCNLNKIKKGDFFYANGDLYQGDLKDIIPNGYGKYFYKDNSSFEGNWLDGKRNGSGKFISSNGNVQSGNWSNNEFVIPPPEPKQVEVITNYNPVKTTEPNSLSATKSNVKNESSTEKKGFSREELIRRIKYVNNRKKCPICQENYKMCTLKTKQELEREKEIILSTYKDGTLLGFSMFFGVLEGKTYDDAINDALKINKYKGFNVCVECADYFRITRPHDWQTIVKEED